MKNALGVYMNEYMGERVVEVGSVDDYKKEKRDGEKEKGMYWFENKKSVEDYKKEVSQKRQDRTVHVFKKQEGKGYELVWEYIENWLDKDEILEKMESLTDSHLIFVKE